MGIQGLQILGWYLMVWRQSERWLLITDMPSDCCLPSNELSARINGFDLTDVVQMNREDQQTTVLLCRNVRLLVREMPLHAVQEYALNLSLYPLNESTDYMMVRSFKAEQNYYFTVVSAALPFPHIQPLLGCCSQDAAHLPQAFVGEDDTESKNEGTILLIFFFCRTSLWVSSLWETWQVFCAKSLSFCLLFPVYCNLFRDGTRRGDLAKSAR